MIVGFLAGLAWGVALTLVLLAIMFRSMRRGRILEFVSGYFRTASLEARVEMFNALFARYCVHCGREMAVPTTCMCDEARAERQSYQERVQAILTELAHPKGSS